MSGGRYLEADWFAGTFLVAAWLLLPEFGVFPDGLVGLAGLIRLIRAGLVGRRLLGVLITARGVLR